MFTDKIEPIISNGVENIGGKYLITKGIVTVSWSWIDNDGKLQTNTFNKVLNFPDLSAEIISGTALDESIKDDDGIWLLTKINIIFILGVLGITKRQYLIQSIIFRN